MHTMMRVALHCLAFLLLGFPVSGASGKSKTIVTDTNEFHIRGGLPNFFHRIGTTRAAHIGYLGGSITAARDGWRDISYGWFRVAYPETMVSQTNAGIGGTGSNLGVFRVEGDVMAGNPALVFVEFAVNDGGRPREGVIRATEGIVRKIWRASPETDICFVYTVDESKFDELREGRIAPAVLAMEEVAEHYGIPSIHFGYEVVRLAREGKLVFTADRNVNSEKIVFTTDKVHPLAESGHPVYGATVVRCLDKIKDNKWMRPHTLPLPLMADNWEFARKIDLRQVETTGWEELPADHPTVRSYGQFVNRVYRGTPGGKIRFMFRGTVLGLYDFLGPRSGRLIVTIDGQNHDVMRFDRHCSYTRLANVLLMENLEDKVHTVEIEVSGDPPDKENILSGEHLEKYRKDPELFDGIEYNIANVLIVGELME